MAVIKKRVHEAKVAVPLRLEESVATMLAEYAKFIDDSKDYIVACALRSAFKSDADFQAHLHAGSANGKPKSGTRKPAPPAEVTPPPIPQTKGI